MSDINENEGNEEYQQNQQVPLTKPKRERSAKQQEAFKRAAEARALSIKKKKEEKILQAQKALLEKEGIINNTKQKPTKPLAKVEQEESDEDEDEPLPIPMSIKVKERKTKSQPQPKQVAIKKPKKEIIYEDSSSEDEDDYESEEDEESSSDEEIFVIKKKGKNKIIKKQPKKQDIKEILPMKNVVKRTPNNIQENQDWTKYFI
jgi:hypothetical protein